MAVKTQKQPEIQNLERLSDSIARLVGQVHTLREEKIKLLSELYSLRTERDSALEELRSLKSKQENPSRLSISEGDFLISNEERVVIRERLSYILEQIEMELERLEGS